MENHKQRLLMGTDISIEECINSGYLMMSIPYDAITYIKDVPHIKAGQYVNYYISLPDWYREEQEISIRFANNSIDYNGLLEIAIHSRESFNSCCDRKDDYELLPDDTLIPIYKVLNLASDIESYNGETIEAFGDIEYTHQDI